MVLDEYPMLIMCQYLLCTPFYIDSVRTEAETPGLKWTFASRHMPKTYM